MTRCHVTRSESHVTRSESRRVRSVIKSFIEKVARSPLGQVELDAEPAIRDFIVDLMLKRSLGTVCTHAILESPSRLETSSAGKGLTFTSHPPKWRGPSPRC